MIVTESTHALWNPGGGKPASAGEVRSTKHIQSRENARADRRRLERTGDPPQRPGGTWERRWGGGER